MARRRPSPQAGLSSLDRDRCNHEPVRPLPSIALSTPRATSWPPRAQELVGIYARVWPPFKGTTPRVPKPPLLPRVNSGAPC